MGISYEESLDVSLWYPRSEATPLFDSFYSFLDNIDVTALDASRLDYLKRYSNNLFAISEVKDVQMPYTEDTTQWLYHNYIDYAA